MNDDERTTELHDFLTRISMAHHEAGHGFVGEILGAKPREISIREKGAFFHGGATFDALDELSPTRQLTIVLAGPAATGRLRGNPMECHLRGKDEADALCYVEKAHGKVCDPFDTVAFRLALDKARLWVSYLWPDIRQLAGELNRRGAIDMKERREEARLLASLRDAVARGPQERELRLFLKFYREETALAEARQEAERKQLVAEARGESATPPARVAVYPMRSLLKPLGHTPRITAGA